MPAERAHELIPLAKVLQHIANNSKPKHGSYMEPLTEFICHQCQRLPPFYDAVVVR